MFRSIVHTKCVQSATIPDQPFPPNEVQCTCLSIGIIMMQGLHRLLAHEDVNYPGKR